MRDEALVAMSVEITVFLDVTQCSLADHYQHREGACRLLKMEKTRSSETAIMTSQTTYAHIPEHTNLQILGQLFRVLHDTVSTVNDI
jgi:hypothetical protein